MNIKSGEIYCLGVDEHIFIISVSPTHVKYYYLDEPNGVINRPSHTIKWDSWKFIQ